MCIACQDDIYLVLFGVVLKWLLLDTTHAWKQCLDIEFSNSVKKQYNFFSCKSDCIVAIPLYIFYMCHDMRSSTHRGTISILF